MEIKTLFTKFILVREELFHWLEFRMEFGNAVWATCKNYWICTRGCW